MIECGRISLQLIPGRKEASIMQTFHCPQVTIVTNVKYGLIIIYIVCCGQLLACAASHLAYLF